MAVDLSANLAENVRRLREARGLTQQELASLSGVPRPTVAHLESGAGNPTIAVLVKLSSALQASIEQLIRVPQSRTLHYRSHELQERHRAGTSLRQLLPESGLGLAFERIELEPASMLTLSGAAPSSRRYITCETGELEVKVESDAFRLKRGDLLVVPGDSTCPCTNRARKITIAYAVLLPAPAGE